MPEQLIPLAPKYRYFTVDLLTNRVLQEIPFRSVSYSRGVNGSGSFDGSIPVIDDTDHLDLDNSTMPAQTALYVVRNGICVWGGIIWQRDYAMTKRMLNVSASEFPSYFHKRRIWKTWIHDVGATVSYSEDTGNWSVVYDYGTSVVVNPGSTVHFDFDEDDNKKFNGHYRVAATPAPTKNGFSVDDGFAVADVATVERKNGLVTIYTAENHGYVTGDVITLDFSDPIYAQFSGTYGITVPGMVDTNVFTFEMSGTNVKSVPTTATARKPLTKGTYSNVTVSVRSDAFDYIRSLINAVAADFVSSEFPNEYIEPGVRDYISVISKRATLGGATFETARPHGLAVGQAVQMKNIEKTLNGEFVVSNVASPTSLTIKSDAVVPLTAISQKSAKIVKFSMTNQVATFHTASNHGFLEGEQVVINAGPLYPTVSGTYTIDYVLTSKSFAVRTFETTAIEETTLSDATLTVGNKTFIVDEAGITGNVATVVTREEPTIVAGENAVLANVDRKISVIEKSLDVTRDTAMLRTNGVHGFRVGQAVTISGLYDSFLATEKSTTTSTTTLRTETPHSFNVGEIVTVSGVDEYPITKKKIASNFVTLTSPGHNIPVGASISVLDVLDRHAVSSARLTEGVATLTVSPAPNFKVNDSIEVTGLTDTYRVVAKSVIDGMVVLTTDDPHNVLEGASISVSGLGAPYDGTHVVSSFTSNRVFYKLDEKWVAEAAPGARKGSTGFLDINIPDSAASGTITVGDGYLNGEYLVSAVSGSNVSYLRVGNNYGPANASGTLSGPSAVNGQYTISSVTPDTLSYAKTAANMPEVDVPAPENETIPAPAVATTSIHSGERTITSRTSNSITFAQNSVSASFHGNTELSITRPSVFNGVHTITSVPDSSRFEFYLPGMKNSVVESSSSVPGYVSANNIYNGTYVITSVDPVTHEVSYARVNPSIARHSVQSTGAASVTPTAIVSSFGPFPGNSDIGVTFEMQDYSGINLTPIAYRGFDLTTVGDALEAYSDNIDGFEYRIDGVFDPETETFRRVFKLLPITLPNPPKDGEVSPLSRFGADKLVFEYPGGSIKEVTFSETGEDSATRFFVSGSTDLGPDAGPPIGIASANDLLRGGKGRQWPLIDAIESMADVEEESTLHAQARRYLSESQPPISDIKLSVNGSIPPYVGTYAPGDWCSINLDDKFIQMRLKNGIEPRDDVIVRKITSMSVKVPDGTTAPEDVSLTLTPEWEVDTRGK